MSSFSTNNSVLSAVNPYLSKEIASNFHFHGVVNFDKQEYFSRDPFIFNTEKGMTALPVTLPPWSIPPKTLETFLHSNQLGYPQKVKKKMVKGTKFGQCLTNCLRMTKINGGKVIFGYYIFTGRKHTQLEKHCVYESPKGKLIDITPPGAPLEVEPYTLFCTDPTFVFNTSENRDRTIEQMNVTHIIWLSRAELKWMRRIKWSGEEIFMSGPLKVSHIDHSQVRYRKLSDD